MFPLKQIICLSPTPWRTIPTRTQQLMTRLKDAQVLFFEPPGRRHREPGRKVRPGLTVYTLPPVLEVEERHQLLFRHGYRKQAKYISKRLEKERFRDALLWCTSPEHVHLLDDVPHRGVVYDCGRDWFDLSPRWESDLALAADVVFAASPGLVDHLSPCNDNIALLPNGANFPMFTRQSTGRPPELARCPGPVLGYVGTLWPDLDLEPVFRAARAMPSCSFVFLGKRKDNPVLDALERLDNVTFLGARPPVEVPDYLDCFDVCLDLPRLDDRKSDVLSPRIYEYLATGKPIVSMACEDLVEPFPDVVYYAKSLDEFTQLCRHALTEAGDWARLRRREHAAQAAWSCRAEEVARILRAIGLY